MIILRTVWKCLSKAPPFLKMICVDGKMFFVYIKYINKYLRILWSHDLWSIYDYKARKIIKHSFHSCTCTSWESWSPVQSIRCYSYKMYAAWFFSHYNHKLTRGSCDPIMCEFLLIYLVYKEILPLFSAIFSSSKTIHYESMKIPFAWKFWFIFFCIFNFFTLNSWINQTIENICFIVCSAYLYYHYIIIDA